MPTKLPTAQVPAIFLGSSLRDLQAFPEDVKDEIGFALFTAQIGGKHPSAKPLAGDQDFRGSQVLEIKEDSAGDTYRAVYTVRFAGALYILHAFQKKSKSGIATPRAEIARIKARLKLAAAHHHANFAKKDTG